MECFEEPCFFMLRECFDFFILKAGVESSSRVVVEKEVVEDFLRFEDFFFLRGC